MLRVPPWPCECYFSVTIHEAPLGRVLSLLWSSPVYSVGPDSSVGIATRYGLDGPRVRSWLWRDIPHPRSALWPTQLPTQWVSGIFSPGVKWPGRAVHRPSPSSAENNEIVELYPSFTSGSSWTVLGRSSTFHILLKSTFLSSYITISICIYIY